MDDMSPAKHAARNWHGTALAALIALIALGLAAYAAAASYDTVSAQAVIHGVSLPRLNPIGIDGGLFGIIIFDIALTWQGRAIWWLRLAARVFALGTVAANAAAGWPSAYGVGLRIAAPALFVLIVEGGRRVLLHARHADERERREARRAERRAERERRRGDRIPAMRWLLDFRGTLAIWKRMQLWREPSYAKAVGMELERLAAIEKLAARYRPGAWQDKAPADLVWMLTAGVRMAEALERVAELTRAEPAVTPVLAVVSARKAAGSARRTGTGPARSGSAPRPDTRTAPEDDLELEARALKLLATNLNMTGGELGRRLGVSEGYGRKLRRRLTDTGPLEAAPDRSDDRTGSAAADRSEGRA